MPLRQKWHSLLAPTKRRNVLQMCREISDCLHILHYSILKSTFRKIRSDQVKIDKSTAKGLEWPRLWIFYGVMRGGCGKILLSRYAASILFLILRCDRLENEGRFYPPCRSSGIYCMISPTSHPRILQKFSIVCVLTLSFLFSLVICPGLMLYVLIKAYWDMPFSRIKSQSLA